MLPLAIGMFAAGTALDIFQTKQQKKMLRMGYDVEQAGLQSSLEAVRLQSAQDSLQSMVNLRKTIGSQIAMNVAKGTSTSAGSALQIGLHSISEYYNDEQSRRINLLQKENQLRAQGVMSGMHLYKSETELGQRLTSRIFKNLPVSSFGETTQGAGDAIGQFFMGESLTSGMYGG